MASGNAWRVLGTGEGDGVILACDYATAARPEAQFSHFVTHLTPARTVWETAMPKPGTESGWRAEDYLDWWTAPLRASGVRVDAVLGFCAGSVFAAGVAREVARQQSQPVPLVVLEPELPGALALYDHYHRAVELFAPVLDRSAVDGMQEAGQELLARDGDLQVFGPALAGLYERVADDAMAKIGLNAGRRAELIAVFTSFINWVVAAGPIDPAPEWAGAVCVSAKGDIDPSIALGRLITVDVDHDRMLADPGVVRTVVDALDQGVRP
ncbi:hypothetical protein RVR_10114 [Actinacidiphila reveromycinica]|uniref:Uncharacterized protein n=1 Tax=Actinacidiphila reveromycinica TaxID=659352 RepID=A0A7U3V0L2_9ACTN|nr:hypothetical protein [Streptomyces sp. SN-593]BBB02267.1 hypothetical protein RVR_10114 [Streptomyces sp. SN-593]